MTAGTTKFRGTDRHEANSRAPLPGESGNGYVARAAAASFAEHMFDLTAAAGAADVEHAAPLLLDPPGVRRLATSLGIDPADFAVRALRSADAPGRIAFFGADLDRRHFVSAVRRFAPASIAVSAHHRALWLLSAFPYCDETWTLLTAACPDPHCGAIQRWRWTRGIDICDRCGSSLGRADTPEIPRRLRDRLAGASGIVHPDAATRKRAAARLPDALAGTTPAAILDLLCAVAGVVDPAIRYSAARQLIDPRAEPGRIIEAVAGAFRVLEEWPEGFVRLASERLSRRPGKHGDGNRGATVAFLDLPSRCSLDPEVAQVIVGVRRLLSAGREAGYLPQEAAAKCGTRLSTILAARREGRIPTVFHLDGNRVVPLLDRRRVDELGAAFRSPYHAAATSLGVTYRTIEELVELGMLDRAPPEPKARPVPAVTGRSLNALVDRIRAAGAGRVRGGVPLEAAMRAVGGGLKPWTGALCAMLDGTIPFSLEGRGRGLVRRAVVDRSAWIPLRDVPQVPEPFPGAFSDAMSKADAADALNLRPSGYVAVLSRWPSSHGWARTVPVSEVAAMTRSLISPAEIAARLDVASKQVGRLMRRAGVRRISVAGYDRHAFDRATAPCGEHHPETT